jgi:hypothetical protein
MPVSINLKEEEAKVMLRDKTMETATKLREEFGK